MEIAKVTFATYLDTRGIKDNIHEVLHPFIAHIHSDDRTIVVTIDAGFYTDFCSVPRIPFAYLLFGGVGQYAGALHDGLYSRSKLVSVVDYDTGEPFKYTRAWADDVFSAALLEREVSRVSASAMYFAVRLRGGSYYKT
jgi:hypothetical protein